MSSLVSVIVPTKNSASTINRCLLSIREQSYKNIEIVVVDNYSTDQTKHIADTIADVVYQLGPERSTQRNFGVEKAKGTYVAIIDSDMYLDDEVIVDCIDAIKKKSGTIGVIVPEQSIGEGFWAKCKQLERSYYLGVPYMEAARFFRKKDFKKVGGYDVNLVSGEDWELSQRIGQLGELARTKAYIRHDEGKLSLWRTMKKKAYYAGLFSAYSKKAGSKAMVSQQTNVIGRYTLFMRKPSTILTHPLIWSGMIFMKTCEFVAIAYGMIRAKKNKGAIN